MRCLGVVLACTFAACASAPSPRVPRAFERFADACQFVPPDMLSFSFLEEELDPEAAGLPATAAQRMLVLRAGRDFEPPVTYGYGKYRGVQVMDFGPGGGAPYARLEKGPPSTTIAGVPVCFQPGKAERPYIAPQWSAWVDNRFLVISSERETLAKALARTGRIDRILEPFASVRELGDDAADITCVLPRPGDQSYLGRFVPTEPVVAAVLPDPWRLVVFHRQPLPPECAELFDTIGSAAKRSSHELRTWTVTEVPLQKAGLLGLDVTGRLVLDLLFGLAIMI